MAISTAYTLTEAKEMLAIWKECERALAEGQAKRYRVGSREFESIDLPEIARMIERFSNIVESLSGQTRNTRVVRVVPRDL